MLRRALILGTCAVTLASATAAHAIGFIDSPSAYCYRVKGNDCVVGWYYMAVDGNPNYIINFRIYFDNVLLFHTQGFFQTSLFLGSDIVGGFHVKCGKAGTSPDPVPQATPLPPSPYGATYSYTIQARDSANLKSANYGTLFCPGK